MGYFQNEIIASHIEVGDRVPEPKPWHSHASLAPSRPLSRRVARHNRRTLRREVAIDFWVTYLLGAVTVATMWILTEVFA